MSAFEELQRQLAESVTARRRSLRHATLGGFSRWWRERLGPGAPAGALALVLIALAAGGLGRPGGMDPSSGPLEAGVAEGSCQACQAVGGRLHGPLGGAVAQTIETARAGRAVRAVSTHHGVQSVAWKYEMRKLR